MGGGTAQDNDGFDVIYAFDLATNSWINKVTHGDSSIPIDESIEEQYPEPRKCHTCAQNGQCKPPFKSSDIVRRPQNLKKKLSYFFFKLLSNVKTSKLFFQIFVTFSEYLNFKKEV